MIKWENLKDTDIVYRLTKDGKQDWHFVAIHKDKICLEMGCLVNFFDKEDPLITVMPEEVADHFDELAGKWRAK